jgi:hypothetical protein
VKLPTWSELIDEHCSVQWLTLKEGKESVKLNPRYEQMARRRYNYSPGTDTVACRLVFLKEVLDNPQNKTLVRNGRFIWCRNLKYEGRHPDGHRYISFTVDKGQKRFVVSEKNCLCIPAKTFINNNRYFRSKEGTFSAFASVFAYRNTLTMMLKNTDMAREELEKVLRDDSPFKPGTLVAGRRGYFHPQATAAVTDFSAEHPCGIILSRSFENNDYSGREFYRVKFGGTTYERVHPVQMEILNEV